LAIARVFPGDPETADLFGFVPGSLLNIDQEGGGFHTFTAVVFFTLCPLLVFLGDTSNEIFCAGCDGRTTLGGDSNRPVEREMADCRICSYHNLDVEHAVF
jgi:hypothetical protein